MNKASIHPINFWTLLTRAVTGESKGPDYQPPKMLVTFRKILNYHRGSKRYLWLEKIAKPSQFFFRYCTAFNLN